MESYKALDDFCQVVFGSKVYNKENKNEDSANE